MLSRQNSTTLKQMGQQEWKSVLVTVNAGITSFDLYIEATESPHIEVEQNHLPEHHPHPCKVAVVAWLTFTHPNGAIYIYSNIYIEQ